MKEKHCEKCGKIHYGVYGSGRFCSNYCAGSFSTLNDDSSEQKTAQCVKCNKEV